MRLLWLSTSLFLLLGTIKLSSSEAQPLTTKEPGIEVLQTTKRPYRWQGDFDNDGKLDTIFAVKITPQFKLSPQIKPLSFWNSGAFKPPQKLALDVVNSRSQQRFMIYGADYFDSPLWHERTLPLQVVRKGTSGYAPWKRQIKHLQGDGLILGTEAGIDTLLYWDGNTYRLYQPAEIP